MPLTETNPLPRFKTDCEPLARKLCKRARAPDLDLEVRRRAYRRGTFIVPVRRGMPVMPVWRGTLVVPAESGWILKHDPADLTSGSVRRMEVRLALETVGLVKRSWFFCQKELSSLFAWTKV